MKPCMKCKHELSAENFSLQRGKYRSICKKCSANDWAAYSVKNREVLLVKWRKYEEIRPKRSQKGIISARCRRDPYFKMKHGLRRRIGAFFRAKGLKKNTFAEQLTGCTWRHVQDHLRSSYTKQMTDSNMGTYWHIDHQIPLSAFDLRDPIHLRVAFHYSNLRPLEAKLNLQKSGTNTKPTGFYDACIKQRINWLREVGVVLH